MLITATERPPAMTRVGLRRSGKVTFPAASDVATSSSWPSSTGAQQIQFDILATIVRKILPNMAISSIVGRPGVAPTLGARR